MLMAVLAMVLCTFILCMLIPSRIDRQVVPATAPPLGYYGADSTKVSVSGVSSGADMSVQLHVAYSKNIMGVGAMAGGPYYCAQASSFIALNACMDSPHKINVDYLEQVTRNTQLTGTIDKVTNMNGARVYLFGGSADTVVKQDTQSVDNTIYLLFFLEAQGTYELWRSNLVTENYGNPCSYRGMPYINNCGYNQAYEILNHIYGNLQRPSGGETLLGDFNEFDQAEFVRGRNPGKQSMDNSGYAYIPSGCRSTSSNCKVHVSIHGCNQSRELLQDEYATHTGYNEVAELNDIIIIYPQAVTSRLNPYSCWDWWGYTGLHYASKLAPQMQAIKGMIERVLS